MNTWMLALLGALAVTWVGAAPVDTSSPSLAPLAFLSLQARFLRAGGAGIDQAKNEGFYQCCVQKGLPGNIRDYCAYNLSEIDEELTRQQWSDLLHCLGDGQDKTECCKRGGIDRKSAKTACNYSPSFIDSNEWGKAVIIGPISAIDTIATCTYEDTYNSSSRLVIDNDDEEDEEDDLRSLLQGDVAGPDREEKSAGFLACCKSKGVFESEDLANACCTYPKQESCRISKGEKFTAQQKSDFLKCLGDGQDDTECCEEAGVGQQSLYACDYSQPSIDPIRYLKSMSVARDRNQVDSIERCVIDGAYNEQSDEEDSSDPTDSEDSPIPEEVLEKKSAGFQACCKSKSLFESAAATEVCCRYPVAENECISQLDKLTEQQQSDWVKCFGDDQDDTECCKGAGISRKSIYACDFSQQLINITRWGKSMQAGDRDQERSILLCTIGGAYNEESGQ